MPPLEKGPREIRNRTRVEILASILSVAANGALKTHIMYKANLSHMQLEKYLAFLENGGFLTQVKREDFGPRLFLVTEKGVDFLREYSRLSGYLNGRS